MVILCVSSSVTFASSSASSRSYSSHMNSSSGVIKNPFVGFPLSLSKPSIRRISFPRFQVRCQDLSLIPKDQRWMFEDSEANGPVTMSKTIYLSLGFLFIFYFFIINF